MVKPGGSRFDDGKWLFKKTISIRVNNSFQNLTINLGSWSNNISFAENQPGNRKITS